MKTIALDVATKCGIAIIVSNHIEAFTIEGTPDFQIREILREITHDCIVVIEDFSYFNYTNPLTTAQLNQRLGYIYWRLIEEGCTVLLYNVNKVRKFLGVHSRKSGEQKKQLQYMIRSEAKLKFSTDETDAIALLLYHVQDNNLSKYKYLRRKKLSNVQKTKRAKGKKVSNPSTI